MCALLLALPKFSAQIFASAYLVWLVACQREQCKEKIPFWNAEVCLARHVVSKLARCCKRELGVAL